MVSKRSCDAPRWWDQGKPVGIFPEQNRQDTRAGVARLGGTWGGHALAEGPWALGWAACRMALVHLFLL